MSKKGKEIVYMVAILAASIGYMYFIVARSFSGGEEFRQMQEEFVQRYNEEYDRDMAAYINCQRIEPDCTMRRPRSLKQLEYDDDPRAFLVSKKKSPTRREDGE